MRPLLIACLLALALLVSMATALQMHERVKRPPRPSRGLRKRVTPIEELIPGGVLPDAIPSKVDWRQGGYIPKVKNSGMCAGIDEADPETTAMAAQVAIANHKKVVPLSDQELVDCVYGCQGGLMHDGMEWLIQHTNGTIDTAATYVSGNGTKNKCNPYQGAVGAQVKAVHTLSKQDSTLAHAVALLGPVVIGVDAIPWQVYTGGILSYEMCKCQQIDHTASIVGYNFEGSKPYWIVRNSWGESWGEDGYAYLAYGNNTCCIRDDAVVPEMYL